MIHCALKHIKIYCKAVYSDVKHLGGWAAMLFFKNYQKKIAGFSQTATKDRMELTAILQALIALNEKCKVTIFTNNTYIENAFNKGWIISWQNNGWLTRYKKPVENQDLWKQILNLEKDHIVKWVRIKDGSNIHRNRLSLSQHFAFEQIEINYRNRESDQN